MSSDHLSHVPAEAMPQIHPAGRTDQSVVLLALAKLVLIAGALAIFAPLWLDLMHQWGTEQAWYSLRLLALSGVAGIVTALVLVFKLLSALFQPALQASDPTRVGPRG